MISEIEERKSIDILMVEDSATDAFLAKEILAESEKALYMISTVSDGIDALSYLRKLNGYEHVSSPDLLLLDLNLPRMHGFELLSEIKRDPGLKTIPVCILTTSDSEADIEKATELGAECYLVKPLDLEEFESVFSRIIKDSGLS